MLVKGLDTSILLYALDNSSAHHLRAVELIDQAVQGKWAACVCDETLSELAAVLTDGTRVRHSVREEDVEKMIDRLTRYPQPQILYSDPAIIKRALRLCEKYPVLRGHFQHALIAATFLAHGVKTIVTGDTSDYSPIRELTVENPFETLFA